MATVARTVDASPEKVFEVLSDGWLYGLWVVGASQIRDVDAAWPAVGSCIHHSIGVWPLVLSDETEVVEIDQPRRLVLSTKARPLGVAKVTIDVQLAGDRTAITMDEVPTAGPGRWVHNRLNDAVLHTRNVKSLDRLASVVENRGRE